MSTQRMTIVDALRGFALAGIVIVHMTEQYVGGPIPEAASSQLYSGIADSITIGLVQLFLRGKFFALFSFLFGLSFFIQMSKADSAGRRFEGRFLWRLLILLALGYLHHLFYRGDILTIYAILGVFLIPFYRVSNKVLWIISGLLFLGLARYILFATTHSTSLFMENVTDPNAPWIASYFETIKNGSFWDVARSNAWSGHIMKADFQLNTFGRGYLTFAFFLLGLWVGRTSYFQNFREKLSTTKRLLWISLGVFVLSIIAGFGIFATMGPNPDMESWTTMFGLTAYDLNNLGMTGLILGLFVLAYRKSKISRWLESFAPYGRMALTNYVVQSIIGTFFFYGWGLGYLAEIGVFYSALIALAIIFVQMKFSSWWLKRYHYGPLEWIWRSLTFGKTFPFRRESLA